jgi:hypothetical protein
MGDPSSPATDVEAEEAAEKGDISQPGGVQADSEGAFEAGLAGAARALDPTLPEDDQP